MVDFTGSTLSRDVIKGMVGRLGINYREAEAHLRLTYLSKHEIKAGVTYDIDMEAINVNGVKEKIRSMRASIARCGGGEGEGGE